MDIGVASNDFLRPFFVTGPGCELLRCTFERVAERTVPEIMNKRCRHRCFGSFDVLAAQVRLNACCQRSCRMKNANAVCKPAVCCPGKYEFRKTQLFDPAQPLKFRGTKQLPSGLFELRRPELNQIV